MSTDWIYSPVCGNKTRLKIRQDTVLEKFPLYCPKYMLTVDEAGQYFGIGEKKIRMLISENADSDFCFTVQVGNKSLINRHKFEEFLNQTTSL